MKRETSETVKAGENKITVFLEDCSIQ